MPEHVGDEQDGQQAHGFDLNVRVGDVVSSNSDADRPRWFKWRQPLAAGLLLLLVAGVIALTLVAR
jgi:hypothetical protein